MELGSTEAIREARDLLIIWCERAPLSPAAVAFRGLLRAGRNRVRDGTGCGSSQSPGVLGTKYG